MILIHDASFISVLCKPRKLNYIRRARPLHSTLQFIVRLGERNQRQRRQINGQALLSNSTEFRELIEEKEHKNQHCISLCAVVNYRWLWHCRHGNIGFSTVSHFVHKRALVFGVLDESKPKPTHIHRIANENENHFIIANKRQRRERRNITTF